MSSLPTTRRIAMLGSILLGLSGCAPAFQESQPSYVVFFTQASAEQDDEAQGVIRRAATAAQGAGNRAVLVEGYADQSGSTEATRALSQLRAQMVADSLVAQGVARERITVRPRGKQGGDPGVESRRVEINVSAQ